MKDLLIMALILSLALQTSEAKRFSHEKPDTTVYQSISATERNFNKYERGSGLKRLQKIRAKINSMRSRNKGEVTDNSQTNANLKQLPMDGRGTNPFYSGTSNQNSSSPFATKSIIDHRRTVKSTSHASEVKKSPISREEPTETEDHIIKLLTKCEKLGPFLDKKSEQGDKARELYGKHCNVVVEQLALKERLDVFYRIHGTYLAMLGNHKDANTYLTHYYQVAPQEFDSNYLMIQNLTDLGHQKIAQDMLKFFKDRNINRSFSITQEEKLAKLTQYTNTQQ